MLDTKTIEKITNIVFDNEAKPKDRLDGAKLLLSAGISVNAICVLLHEFVNSADYSNSVKVKSANLLNTYEVIEEVKAVDTNVDELKAELLKQYGVGFVDLNRQHPN